MAGRLSEIIRLLYCRRSKLIISPGSANFKNLGEKKPQKTYLQGKKTNMGPVPLNFGLGP